MQIAFTRKGRNDNGQWSFTNGENKFYGTWVCDRFDNEFNFGSESSSPEGAMEKWLKDRLDTWLSMLEAPYSWQRVVFQEEAFIVEIHNEEVHNQFVVSGWNMMHQDISPRFNSNYHRIEDAAAATLEVTECMKWMYQEFAGLEHTQTVPDGECILEGDDNLDILDKPADLIGYALMVGQEFREKVNILKAASRRYRDTRKVVDHLYWVTADMHERELMTHDDYDLTSTALYIRRDETLTMKDEEGNTYA